MARIEGEIITGRPTEAVFDFAADQRNEPRYNPRMIRADKVSDRPVPGGTWKPAASAITTVAVVGWPSRRAKS